MEPGIIEITMVDVFFKTTTNPCRPGKACLYSTIADVKSGA